MSHNSKNARKIRAAKARKGQKGPASTKKLHKKVRTWYNPESATYWKKPKEAKKSKGDDEVQALKFFRALRAETEKQHRLQRMRDNMGV